LIAGGHEESRECDHHDGDGKRPHIDRQIACAGQRNGKPEAALRITMALNRAVLTQTTPRISKLIFLSHFLSLIRISIRSG
jgi:hypothetical protein